MHIHGLFVYLCGGGQHSTNGYYYMQTKHFDFAIRLKYGQKLVSHECIPPQEIDWDIWKISVAASHYICISYQRGNLDSCLIFSDICKF